MCRVLFNRVSVDREKRNTDMPKIKKFRDLCRRQQNRRLLKQRIAENSKDLEILVANDNRHSVITEDVCEENYSTIEISPEILHTEILRSDDNIELTNVDLTNVELTNSFATYNAREQKPSLQDRLRTWAVEHNVTQKSLTALLHIWREEGYDKLPSDARTLLGTPKETVIRECGNGQYFHYGLQRALCEILRYDTSIDNTIIININIDGLPLSKSSQSQLWPILAQINNNKMKPFLIGAYHGYKKPAQAQYLLQEFCDEYCILHEEGFFFRGKHYHVQIRAIICDTPAKSFVTATKGHNAYFGCGNCLCEGDYLNHKMVFLNSNAALRTDSNFRSRENEDHHISVSPFEKLLIDMIRAFPLDYMHLVCLGVMKKLLQLWLKGNLVSRLCAADVEALSNDILSLQKFISIEFARRPRSINELDRWKATEFRMFLLYFGPIILMKYLPVDYVRHFCTLHTAIRILCEPEDCLRNNKYAEELLLHFVETFKILYGEDHIVYNVHNLLHLCEDVKRYGSLDTFSAFQFENHMKTLKKMLRKSDKPLCQLHNRITEFTKISSNNPDNNPDTFEPLLVKPDGKNLPLGCVRSHREIRFAKFKLTRKPADNCCYVKDGSVFCIDYIGFKNDIAVFLGRKYMDLRPIPIYPCNSQDMKIHKASRLKDIEMIPITEIEGKAFRIILNDVHYIMPLLHLEI